MLTKTRALAFTQALVKLRDSISDEQAIEVAVLYPEWREGVAYEMNARVLYNDVLYRVLTTHISQSTWTPDVTHSLFAKVLIADNGDILPWEQPESTNPYMVGDKVIFKGEIYESLIDNNIWSPATYPTAWNRI